MRLKEIVSLTRTNGFDAAKALLDSGGVEFHCDPMLIIQNISRDGIPANPIFHYSLGYVRMGDRRQFIHDCLQSYHETPGLSQKQIVKLKKLTAERVLGSTSGEDKDVTNESASLLRSNAPVVRSSINLELTKRLNVSPLLIPSAFTRYERVFFVQRPTSTRN
jgi:hypothetical protein